MDICLCVYSLGCPGLELSTVCTTKLCCIVIVLLSLLYVSALAFCFLELVCLCGFSQLIFPPQRMGF